LDLVTLEVMSVPLAFDARQVDVVSEWPDAVEFVTALPQPPRGWW
jgi:hypothetical protein